MKRIIPFITFPPLILAGIAVLAYGVLAPQLGFYWDDLPIGWIRYQLGAEALTRYFSTNRPPLGVLYQSLTSLLPFKPIYWQFLILILRWLSSLLFWGIFQQLFPRRKNLSLIAALLFLIYPGFNQQFVSFVYTSHFFALFFFLFSIFAMLQSFKQTRFSQIWAIVGMLSSAANLLLGEYFFLLELIRIPILWIKLEDISISKERIRRMILTCLPYFIIFLLAIIGRVFFFSNETYEYNLLAEIRVAPLATLWLLFKTVLLSLWTTLIAAWGQAFTLPDFNLQGKITITIYIAIILFSFIATFFAFSVSKKSPKAEGARRDSLILIVLGLFVALLAGVPFWLTGLPVSLGFPANRATLPFMLGSVFVLVGISSLIPQKKLRITLLALLIAFSAGRQFLWADEFRRDWNVQKNLFWQLSWRIPALEENTTILLNEGALKFYADNSLSAPLNWIYAPETDAENIPYMLFYPRTRFGVDSEKLQPEMPLQHDFIAGEFNGNSAQMLLVNFSPPGCLHVLDPELDSANKFISDLLLRDAAPYSRPELILEQGEPEMPNIYAPEPKHGWCYYFQKADLARQHGDWERVVSLGEIAFSSGDHPNDPTENLVFIEAYAHTNAWEDAEQLSLRAKQVSPSYMRPLLCPLWDRIDVDVSNSPEKEQSIARMRDKLSCE